MLGEPKIESSNEISPEELGAKGYFIKAHYSLEEIAKEVRKALK
ncbi:MAG: hypothetical protein WC310_01125 [Patescibacteria group bacterium]|jgi:hypothetical protein